jgi:hypothetical protein
MTSDGATGRGGRAKEKWGREGARRQQREKRKDEARRGLRKMVCWGNEGATERGEEERAMEEGSKEEARREKMKKGSEEGAT